ncbi:endo-1,4-beta-xylanase [Synoicihabitans lomoniglobus]|uniref:Beta-xylanase n=1 Tax=Synoicihabitans lomoniglobus TaxID=2909285 RepID=A0AAF0CSF1_9BACT|nr:endo-1,4-beta-xylanase [Opitutaceae bacterium LMO-M01]WED67253.1 endo-1,4-beta-xylanase [Opitutaceae bacterium LMO-M01]
MRRSCSFLLPIATATLATLTALSGCLSTTTPVDTTATSPATLRSALAGKFRIGATTNGWYLRDTSLPVWQIVNAHFDTLTAGNAQKWGVINPQPGEYRWESADAFVDYADAHDLYTIGHCLFWHSQTPDWVYEDSAGQPLTRDALLARMRERVQLYADRWGDRVDLWDVVNESIEADGSKRRTKFNQIIGDDFEEQAFRMADAILPASTKLIYNDYGMTAPGRRAAVVEMVNDFKAKGVRIDGIGIQAHWSMHRPTVAEIEETIVTLASTGLPLHLTELDVDFLGRDQFFGADGANVDLARREATPENNPFPDGLPPEEEAKLTQRYAKIFAVLLKHADKIDRVTFWGITDRDSWLNNWPARGRTNYPLLFDRDGQPKPALRRIIELAHAAN